MVESLPTVLGTVAKSDGVLQALYSDLAAPGVRQVGLALETVLKTGSILLLPLRMLNEYAANFERNNFREIAERLCEIPEEDIVDIRPEIGVPILERLSATHDPDLRKLFIELLASAANCKSVEVAHPSFVRVIENLSPDEAKILAEWKDLHLIPCLAIGYKAEEVGSRKIYDPYLEVPDSLISPDLASMFIANLEGLGLVTHHSNKYVTEQGAYDAIIIGAKGQHPSIKEELLSIFQSADGKIEVGDYFYHRGCVEITTYGKAFQKACLS
jgi:hypothetical protein